MRRKDTTKGAPLRILSLDGGGVRGYSMLILLQELMYKTFNEAEGKPPKPNEIPKPCDYFDLIVGSGTGGLIAIMLGRLRMDIEKCKEVYVRMTRRVFETDKTIAGIPYRSTLFKASKLEEAIRDCVKEHTLAETEGNDGSKSGGTELPMTPTGSIYSSHRVQRRQSATSSIRSGRTAQPQYMPMSPGVGGQFGPTRWGNPDASLYDNRGNRTKTAVTAVFKGTSRDSKNPMIFLRSYDSRATSTVESHCTIWEAGRATCAIGLAFKPIQVGQSIFHDEGAGHFNPTPQVVDEVRAEWEDREVGVLVSIGTGKRPAGTDMQKGEWWEDFVGGSAGSFLEAKRKLFAKIEACEAIHKHVRDKYLKDNGINPDNYYRLNVEIGVGSFGMNEWDRLAEISTNTRMYLSKPETKHINESAALKLGKIQKMKNRMSLSDFGTDEQFEETVMNKYQPPAPQNFAVELPGDEGASFSRASLGSRGNAQYRAAAAPDDKFAVVPEDQQLSPHDARASNNFGRRLGAENPPRSSADGERTSNPSSIQPSPRRSYEQRPVDGGAASGLAPAPPLPPKTPLNAMQNPHTVHAQNATTLPNPQFYNNNIAHRPKPNALPYPVDDDEPPPQVDMGRKPTLQR